MQLEIVKNELLNNLRIEDLQNEMDFIEKGTYGVVYKVGVVGKQPLAMKKIDLLKGDEFFDEKQDEILREITLLKKLSQTPSKPRSLPKFFGHFITNQPQLKQLSYNLLFEFKEGSLQKLIRKRQEEGRRFTLDEIYCTMQSLLHTMTYLQLSGITHRDLKPGNVLYSNLTENGELQYKSLTLIDFGGSKCLAPYNLERNNTVVLTKRYCSPELLFFSAMEGKEKADFNPFKSDAFSLGLILLEMAAFKLPFSDKEGVRPHEYFRELDGENKKLIGVVKGYYMEIAKKGGDQGKKVKDVVDVVSRALVYLPEKRADFVELFCNLFLKKIKHKKIYKNFL